MALDATSVVEKQGLAAFVLEVERNHYPSEFVFSDYAAFFENGYSAISIGDTGQYRYPYGHSAQDTVDKLDPDFTVQVISGVAGSLREPLARP